VRPFNTTVCWAIRQLPSKLSSLNTMHLIGRDNISLKCFCFFSKLETGETLAGFVSYTFLYATVHKPHLCSSSLAATAAAKPQATIVIQGGEGKMHQEVLPKSNAPDSDGDFVDTEDGYRMPWDDIEESRRKGFGNPAVGSDGPTEAEIGLEVTGSDNFIAKAKANELVAEYQDVFSRELNPEPADLPPLDVPIGTKKWHSPKNQERARYRSV